MDDITSRKQIDELADLYLTNPGQDSQRDQPSAVDGPAPIKLAPKLGDDAASTATSDRHDQLYDASYDDGHPVLRLTEDDSDDQVTATLDTAPPSPANDPPMDRTSNEPAPKAVLEAVLMGNLPGMSGPWLTQYAQLLAQTEGPVVLLHIGEEAIDLELVEPRAEAQPAPAHATATVRIPPMRGNRTGLVGLIDALVRSDSAPARTILVRFDTTTDPQMLSRLAALDDWTLLCGSDEASIASASKKVRAAVHADPRLADHNVGIMIMGSDEAAAQQAADRIGRELEHDLVHRAELIGHLKRMQPVQVRDLGSFPDPISIWPKLVAYFDSLEVPEPIQLPEPAPKAQPPVQPARTAPKTTPTPSAAPAAASRPEPTPRFRQAPPKAAPAPSTPQPQRATRSATPQRPKQAPPAAPARPQPVAQPANPPMRSAPTSRVLTPQPELDLVALLAQGPAALQDPVTLDARIPDQPQTQLAVDADGTVHILLKKVSDTLSEDVMRLMEAGQWVREHLELIALTQRDRTFVDQAPVLHLLTDRADLTTQLISKLAGQVKLHLLQQVQLGKESGWFCTPLG